MSSARSAARPVTIMVRPVAWVNVPRPSELQLEGCVVRFRSRAPADVSETTFTARVLRVYGPRKPDPWFVYWLGREDLGGWGIEFEHIEPPHLAGRIGWVNEVFVEDGRIYAYPWRDEIEVVEVSEAQLSLF